VDQTLTLQDIAQLTDVTRQAVTNWRRRPTVRGGIRLPFPRPLEPIGEIERFDREQISQWLLATGRGKNADSDIDAPALTVPDDVTLADAVTMLTLRAATGDDLSQMSVAERTALAGQLDPGDQFLLSEVKPLSEQHQLSTYVDALMDASYGPPDALDRLYTTRLARWEGDHGLSDELVKLLTTLAATCREHIGSDDVAIDLRIDPRARSVAQGFATVRSSGRGGNGPDVREMLRHLAIDGIEIATAPSPTVHVISGIGREDHAVLDLADSAALELGPHDIALVLGAASALCDPLRGKLARLRSDTLEMGRLVAALRLPRGMRRAAYRQSLGLWILEGGASRERLVVADFVGESIDVNDLASDVAAALEQVSSRSYRYGRLIRRQEAQGRAAVVATGIRAVRLAGADSSTHGDRVTAATLVTREPLDGFDVLVTPKPPATATTPRSLGEMVAARRIELLSGSRVNVEHAEPSGTIRVLSADPASQELQIDPLIAAERYRHAKRTRPGDIVFVDRPRPSALVDDLGGSLVRAPSRILRLPSGAGIGPRALAEVINHLPDDAGEWGTWSIPSLAPDQINDVEQTLADAEIYAAELRRRESAMNELITNLIQGLAVDGLTITSPTTNKKAG
jgi:hypothetical protein